MGEIVRVNGNWTCDVKWSADGSTVTDSVQRDVRAFRRTCVLTFCSLLCLYEESDIFKSVPMATQGSGYAVGGQGGRNCRAFHLVLVEPVISIRPKSIENGAIKNMCRYVQGQSKGVGRSGF